jgi:hypothetical protein
MELEVEYQKVETNRKSLELTIAMDACKFIIVMKQVKHLERENVDLDTRLRSQVDDLRESIKTIEHMQLSI